MTPEPYPLTHAHWKTERAKAHIDELKSAIATFEADNPYKVTACEEPERDAVRYKIEITHPHVWLFLIAADALQCLRTALDQAIWSLARLTCEDPGRTQFPVFKDRPTSKNDFARWEQQTSGVPPKAVEFIETLQPYNRPEGAPITSSPLWLLHEMNRIDKHCSLSVRRMGTLIHSHNFAPHPDFARTTVEETDYGCDVLRFGIEKGIQPEFSPMIVFGEEKSGVNISVNEIERIYEFVADHVLPRLAGFARA
jgi:hypothetical protein